MLQRSDKRVPAARLIQKPWTKTRVLRQVSSFQIVDGESMDVNELVARRGHVN
jgi:hypothetical protein